MAGMLYANPGRGFVGHKAVFQFVNADGLNPGTVCGPAAVATVLASRGLLPKVAATLRLIEGKYPPDLNGGKWGTSPGQIKAVLDGHKVTYWNATGREGLVAALKRKCAAITLIQNTPGLCGIGDGAHWFVVFGADDKGVHVSNYYKVFIPWTKFEELRAGAIPYVAGLGERTIAC